MRQPRPPRGCQRQDRDADATDGEQPSGHEVLCSHVERSGQRNMQLLEEQPYGAVRRAAYPAEYIEPCPVRRGGDDERQVHRQPASRSARQRRCELAHPPCPPAQHQQRAEEQQRVELRRRRRSDQHSGKHRPPGRPRHKADHPKSHGDEVPVGERRENNHRRQCHQQRVAPAVRAREPRRRQYRHNQKHRQQGGCQVIERRGPRLGVSGAPDQRCHHLHRHADANRVLHGVPQVRHDTLGQALTEVQRVDVGVAQVTVGAAQGFPVASAARQLLRVGQHDRDERRGQQRWRRGQPFLPPSAARPRLVNVSHRARSPSERP